MTCDSSGQNLVVATGSNGIFRSTDYGVSWTSNSIAPIDNNQNYNIVSSDSTGQYLVASDYNNLVVYASTDYGSTWILQNIHLFNSSRGISVIKITPNADYMYAMITDNGFYINQTPPSPPAAWIYETENNFNRFVCDASGKFIAGFYGSTVYTSFDYGQHWSSGTQVPDSINDIACNSTGQYIVLSTGNYEVLYKSTNYGRTFREIIMPVSSAAWLSITSDSSGQYLVAGQYGSDMYYSINSGTSWTQSNVENPLPDRFTSIVSSYNGQYVVATGFNDATSDSTIYTSADYGANFTNWNPIQSGVSISQLACDSTGQYVLAAAGTQGIYQSSNYGVSWTLTSAHIPNHNYQSVASDATGQYLVAADSNNHT